MCSIVTLASANEVCLREKRRHESSGNVNVRCECFQRHLGTRHHRSKGERVIHDIWESRMQYYPPTPTASTPVSINRNNPGQIFKKIT